MTNDSALLPFQQLDIYRVARELAIAVREAEHSHTELRDQAGRASISAFLTLSEGAAQAAGAARAQAAPLLVPFSEAIGNRGCVSARCFPGKLNSSGTAIGLDAIRSLRQRFMRSSGR